MKSLLCARPALALALGLVLCAGVRSAWATNGAFLTGNGPISAGMGGAAIALANDASVGADNPAGMASVGSRLDLYGSLLHADSNSTFGSPQNEHNSHVVAIVPGLGFNYQLTPDWTAGVTVYGSGLASDYRSAVVPIPGAGVAKASYTVAIIAPTVAHKIGSTLSVGASVLFGIQQFRLNGLVAPDGNGGLVPVPSHGNSYATGVGGALGVQWKPNDMLTIGASYYSKIRFGALNGYKDDLLAADGGRIDTPARYGIGIALRPIDGLTLAADYLRIEWSKAAAFRDPSSFGWHDQNVARIGLEYEINRRWKVRAGYNHANSHLDSDHTLANFFANGIVHRSVTIGIGYNPSERHRFNAAFEYNIPRTLVGTGPSTGTNISTRFHIFTLGYSYLI